MIDVPRDMDEPGWLIIGPYGNIWVRRLFETPEEAERYVRDFWKGNQPPGFSIARGRMTLSVDLKREVRDARLLAPHAVPAEVHRWEDDGGTHA